MAEEKRYREFVFSTQDKVNDVGSRVMSAGIDVEQFKKNSVLLYMHQRFGKDDMPIGSVADLRLEGDKWIGRPVFDQDDPHAARIADKWAKGFLKMVSPLLEIIETSTDPALMLPGQTRPTITRSKLVEISIVDIGGNDDALQLCYAGDVLKLAHGEPCDALPLLTHANQPDKGIKTEQMNEDLKTIALALGLSESSTREQILAAIAPMKEQAGQVETLRLAAVTAAVDRAVEEKRITADKKDHFVALGKAAGIESLNATLALMKPAAKPTDLLRQGKETLALKFDDLTAEQLEEMRTSDQEKYCALFKEKYGYNPTIEA